MSKAIKVLYGLDIDIETKQAKNGNFYTTLKFNNFDHEEHKKHIKLADQKRATEWHTRTLRVFYNEKTIKFSNSVFMYYKGVKGLKRPPKNRNHRDYDFYAKNPEIVEKIKNTPWKTKYKFGKSKFIFKITKKGKLQVLERLNKPHYDRKNNTTKDNFRDVTKNKKNGFQLGWENELLIYLEREIYNLGKMYATVNNTLPYYYPNDNLHKVAKVLFTEIKSKVKELERKHEYLKARP